MQATVLRAILLLGIGAAAVVAAVAALFLFPAPVEKVEEKATELEGYEQTIVTVNGVSLVTDIADTSEKKTRGLGVRESMDENEAMIFLFDDEAKHSFWMKGMKFPIDIIWLDSNKRIVHIEHSLEPCQAQPCQSYVPDKGALYVLETVAGFAEKHGLQERMKVEFELV
jgi:uncharacterized membrane protein (UPF0127 family)